MTAGGRREFLCLVQCPSRDSSVEADGGVGREGMPWMAAGRGQRHGRAKRKKKNDQDGPWESLRVVSGLRRFLLLPVCAFACWRLF